MQTDEVGSLISCVIPVYNGERFLHRTLECLLGQTYDNIEILCIDDASVDESRNIIEEYLRRDHRVRLLRNRYREGASNSRNKGLFEAKGKYVIFLDADDVFFENMLEESYKAAELYQTDIVMFGYEQYTIHNGIVEAVYTIQYEFEVIDKDIKTDKIPDADVPWNKLIRREFLLREGIIFQDVPTNADVFFSLASLTLAKKLVLSDGVLLRYFYGQKDSLSILRQQGVKYDFNAYETLLIFLRKKNMEFEMVKWAIESIIKRLILEFMGTSLNLEYREQRQQQFYGMKDFLKEFEEFCKKGALSSHADIFLEMISRKENLAQHTIFECYKHEIRKIYEECQSKGYTLAVWGCGERGKLIIDGMLRDQMTIDYLIDSDKSKQGTEIMGCPVCDYREIEKSVDVILITSQYVYYAMRKEIKGKKIVFLWE